MKAGYFFRCCVAEVCVWAAFGASAQAAHVYVKTGGVPQTPYASWADAFTNLQTALDYVELSAPLGANIYLAGGTYESAAIGGAHPETSAFLLQSVSNVVIRGGYEGASGSGDSPGANDPVAHPTVLRLLSGTGRVLTMVGVSNVVVEGVTIRDGNKPGNNQGGGVHVAASPDVRFTDVVIRDNLVNERGGGVYLTGNGSIVFESCSIVSNRTDLNVNLGCGIFMQSSSVLVTNTLVATNRSIRVSSGNPYVHGGGIYVGSGGNLTLRRSIIRGNFGNVYYGAGHNYGGGIYVLAGGTLDARESVVANNRLTWSGSSGYVLRGAGIANSGTMLLQNVLVVGNTNVNSVLNGRGDGVWSGGTTVIENCTVADNNLVGVYRESGAVTVTNAIIWGHSGLDIQGFVEDDGVYPAIWYSNIGGGMNAGFQGGQSTDPLFADRVHYHLRSSATEGFYTNAYFNGGIFGSGTWVASTADSPLIARGDPASDYSREPTPNGGRINMGAYGNTGVASKKADTATSSPTAVNHGAIEWGPSSAFLRGEVTDDGGETAEGYFRYWADGSSVTSVVARGIQTGAFSHRPIGLTANTLYHYQAGATKSLGMGWSSSASFQTHPAASHYYVSSGGDNTAGTNWATAYPDLRTALSLARNGDAIYLAGGQTFSDVPAFLDTTVFRWQGATNVVLRGGYQATSGSGGIPGASDPETWPTILSRTSGDARILTLDGLSNAVIERVTIRDGYRPTQNQGGGVRLSASKDVRFNEVSVIHNQAQNGAGFYITGSTDVIIESSSVVSNTFPSNGNSYGAGIFSATSTLTVTNVLIANGVLGVGGGSNRAGLGGGLYVASGTVNLIRSIVRDNRTENWYGATTSFGGGISVAAGATLNSRDVVVVGNNAIGSSNGQAFGGGIGNLGTLHLKNALVASNQCFHLGDGIITTGNVAVVRMDSVTIADNNPLRVDRRGVHYRGGAISITNSIIDGHAFDLSNFGAGQLANVSHSNIRDGQNEGVQGCLALDPLFVDRQYYHLQSTVSNYTGAYFEGGVFGSGTWAVSAGYSPLIAKGDANSDFSLEPMPNGGRINMGAYGNSEVASMWADIQVDPPAVSTYGALRWGYTTAHLRGEVTDTGGEIPEAFFRFWPSLGGGSTTTVSRSLQAGAFVLNATGLTPGTEYNFQAGATNAGGMTWANTESFSTLALGDPLYVSAGGNDTAGSTWAAAYTNLQTAFDLAVPGTVVYLSGETFQGSPLPAANEIFTWQNASNVTIRGGYDADTGLASGAHPGPRTGETIIRRASGEARVLTMSGLSNSVIDQVTVRNGYRPLDNQGGGIRLADSQGVRFENVTISGNEALTGRGAGIYVINSTDVVFYQSAIVSNSIFNGTALGGGLYVQASSVTITNSQVTHNTAYTANNYYVYGYGGGVYLHSGTMVVGDSLVSHNKARANQWGYGALGGAFYIAAAGTLDMQTTALQGNMAEQTSGGSWYTTGGAIMNLGTLNARNVLVISNLSSQAHSDGILSTGTVAVTHLNNVTIADNNTANPANVGVRYIGGTLSVSNSIVWGHNTDLMNLPVDGSGHLQNVGYSLFGGIPAMHEINGCIVGGDPLFADTVYYHLQSTEGVYEGGFFSGGTWEKSLATSPAIDTGDAETDWSGEPAPHGRRINMGAYGGTSVASMTPTIRGSVFMFR